MQYHTQFLTTNYFHQNWHGANSCIKFWVKMINLQNPSVHDTCVFYYFQLDWMQIKREHQFLIFSHAVKVQRILYVIAHPVLIWHQSNPIKHLLQKRYLSLLSTAHQNFLSSHSWLRKQLQQVGSQLRASWQLAMSQLVANSKLVGSLLKLC